MATDDTTEQITFHEHPDFRHLYPQWRTHRDLYENLHSVLTLPQYLVLHALEYSTELTPKGELVGQRIRSIRTQRTRNLNLFEPIVSNYVSMALSKPLAMDDATKALLGEEGVENIDGKNTNFENFVKGPVAISYFRDGRVFLAADVPGGEFRSLAEQRAAGSRPYLHVLDVLDVKDWQTSEAEEGRLEALRVEYRAVERRASLREEPKEASYCKEFELGEVENVPVVRVTVTRKGDEQGARWEQVTTKDLPFADIPVAAIFDNEPWVKDVAEQQLALLNLLSNWLNKLNGQGIQQVYFAGALGEKHQVAISEYTMGILPENTQVHVVPPADTGGDERAIEWTIDQMYRVAFNRQRGVSGTSKEAPGADTIREMNEELLQLLLTAISEIEQVVNQALRHYAAFKGVRDFKGKVTLNRDLSAEDVGRMVETFLAFKDEIVRVLPWRKALLKKVAAQEEFSEDETAEILKAIDALKDPEPLTGVASLTGVADALSQNADATRTAPNDPPPQPGDGAGGVGRKPRRKPGAAA